VVVGDTPINEAEAGHEQNKFEENCLKCWEICCTNVATDFRLYTFLEYFRYLSKLKRRLNFY